MEAYVFVWCIDDGWAECTNRIIGVKGKGQTHFTMADRQCGDDGCYILVVGDLLQGRIDFLCVHEIRRDISICFLVKKWNGTRTDYQDSVHLFRNKKKILYR